MVFQSINSCFKAISELFINLVIGFQFEWAWQHPDKSRRLRHLTKKRTKETAFQYRFRIVSNMLRTGPWNRLALTVRWLKQEYKQDFLPDLVPPLHMAIAYGLVKSKKVKGNSQDGRAPEEGSNSQAVSDDLDFSQSSRHPRCAICVKRIQVILK